MRFAKMHGAGNDFIVIDARSTQRQWDRLAIEMCDRHFGVGGDGILVVEPSRRASVRMRMFNPDGSESDMCANGLRCIAKYVVDEGLSPAGGELTIETGAGVNPVSVRIENGTVVSARVGMGQPRFDPSDIPVARNGADRVVDYDLDVDGESFAVTCLSMGNPHAVAFIDGAIDDIPLEVIGPKVEHHPFFPERVNFEIVNVRDRGHLDMRVWERGAGITLACGSGASAVGVAARLKGLTDDEVSITLPGGELRVGWPGEGEVWLEGPAKLVFTGEWAGDTHQLKG
jgi:diaminopimelate epimerase